MAIAAFPSTAENAAIAACPSGVRAIDVRPSYHTSNVTVLFQPDLISGREAVPSNYRLAMPTPEYEPAAGVRVFSDLAMAPSLPHSLCKQFCRNRKRSKKECRRNARR